MSADVLADVGGHPGPTGGHLGSTGGHLDAAGGGTRADAERLASRLKFYVAAVAALGGLVLAFAASGDPIPAVAVFFAAFGHVAVDRLRLFELPPALAYVLMGLIATYCISDFVDLAAPGNRQLMAVSQLLVFVQAVLMLQRKTVRTLEQVLVFCLLQLVVAGVFNRALSFGVLLIPICIVGALALSMLASLHAVSGMVPLSLLPGGGTPSSDDGWVRLDASASFRSLRQASRRLTRLTMGALVPAVAIIGFAFFYTLPRTTRSDTGNRGIASVGFSDSMDLNTIGRMNRNTSLMLRATFVPDDAVGSDDRIDAGTDGGAVPRGGVVYFRGRPLERYTRRSGRVPAGTWRAVIPSPLSSRLSPLPEPRQGCRVEMTVEPSTSPTLFLLPPAGRIGDVDPPEDAPGQPGGIQYAPVGGVLSRDASRSQNRVRYSFRSSAYEPKYRDGIRPAPLFDFPEAIGAAGGVDLAALRRLATRSQIVEEYRSFLTESPRTDVPAASRLASRFETKPDGRSRNAYELAVAIERHLSTSPDYQYTLDLPGPPPGGTDPVEHFLTTSRRGHCQFFASSLALALRTRRIPTRIVVGYATEEYNALVDRYVARGSHAHAWVEALIRDDQMPDSVSRRLDGVASEPPNATSRQTEGRVAAARRHYWVRLDPTPAARFTVAEASRGIGNRAADLAREVWDDYVIDMDRGQQPDAFSADGNALSRSYNRAIQRASLVWSRFRNGDLGAGRGAGGSFSVVAAIVTFVGIVLVVAVASLGRSLATGRRRRSVEKVRDASIDFYRDTLTQVGRIGVRRRAAQTPAEVFDEAVERWDDPMTSPIDEPLAGLTEQFYRRRFGGLSRENEDSRVGEWVRQLRRTIDAAPPRR